MMHWTIKDRGECMFLVITVLTDNGYPSTIYKGLLPHVTGMGGCTFH